LIAAQQSVTAARSQEALARANGKQDLTAGASYSHTGGFSSAAVSFNIPLAVFDRTRARLREPATPSRRPGTRQRNTQQVGTDVVDAYENLRSNDLIIQLYAAATSIKPNSPATSANTLYRRGAASLLDFLDFERTYRSNQLAYRQALANYMLASSSCVRPWAQGIFHDQIRKFVSLLSLLPRRRACRLWLWFRRS